MRRRAFVAMIADDRRRRGRRRCMALWLAVIANLGTRLRAHRRGPRFRLAMGANLGTHRLGPALRLAMIADDRLGTTIRLVTRVVPGGPVVAIAIRLVDADDRRGRRVPVHEPTGVVVRAVPAAVVVTPVEPVAVEHRVVVVGADLDARRDLDEIRRRAPAGSRGTP